MLPPAIVAVHLLALGTFASPAVRLAADDWCAAARIRAYGSLGFIDYYYFKVNGRLAYHVGQVLVFADGLRGARVLPFVLIVTLTVGILTVLYLVLRHLRWRWPAAVAGFLAVVVSALTFFAGNAVYQILFWPAATVTHTLPAILGIWNVIIQCPPHKSADGYNMRFQAEVKDGMLQGQHGVAGEPSSVILKGKIQPDGVAIIDARGVTGDPRNTIKRLVKGSPYSYRVDARFDEVRGSGERVEVRPCTLTFVK